MLSFAPFSCWCHAMLYLFTAIFSQRIWCERYCLSDDERALPCAMPWWCWRMPLIDCCWLLLAFFFRAFSAFSRLSPWHASSARPFLSVVFLRHAACRRAIWTRWYAFTCRHAMLRYAFVTIDAITTFARLLLRHAALLYSVSLLYFNMLRAITLDDMFFTLLMLMPRHSFLDAIIFDYCHARLCCWLITPCHAAFALRCCWLLIVLFRLFFI